MALRRLFGILLFSLFLLSSVQAVVVTDITTTDLSNAQTQSFASINARLVDLTNQIQSARVDDLNFYAQTLKKGDLQNIYENILNINKQSAMEQLTSNIVLFLLAFCVMFLLIGKNMLPAHRKEDKLSTTKENLRLNKENEGLLKELEKLKAVPKEKKGWFGKKKVVGVQGVSAPTVPPVNPHLEALKKEVTPVPQWQREVIALEARLELLKEQAKQREGI